MKIYFLLFPVLFCSCFPAITNTTKKTPTIKTTPTSQPIAYCGSVLKNEPKSVILTHNDQRGVWVSMNRYKCLVVRQRGYLKSRKLFSEKTDTLLQQCKTGFISIINECEQREKRLSYEIDRLKAQSIVQIITYSAISVGLGFISGFAIGYIAR